MLDEGAACERGGKVVRGHSKQRLHVPEFGRLLEELQRTWGIAVRQPSVLALNQATRFYRAKQLTDQEITRGLSR
jgi:hypothetical protein